MSAYRDRTDLMKKELKEYEKTMTMTKPERRAMHEWVSEGNSVHENPDMAVDDSGMPVDFLYMYREDQKIQKEFSVLTDKEQEMRIVQYKGEDTSDTMSEQSLKMQVYERVIREHHLLEEADQLIQEFIEQSQELNDELKDLPDLDELPFK
jgi:hypothetical protein